MACNIADLQSDIESVQTIGGYAYGVSYGIFLITIFVAAVCTESKSEEETDKTVEMDQKSILRTKSLKTRGKNIGKTMMRLKNIYFVILVHMFDTLTDFLIMLEWYVKGAYELKNEECSFPNLNYMGCFFCGVVILLFYRILSSQYVYKYYQQSKLKAIIQFIFQLLDISIFYEVYQSHLHQATTDNLSYLSKLEKTFESSPQLILQLYVLMRELSQGFAISYITVISILFSLISLASKVISDDEAMFFKEANKKYKIQFFARALFRICEISARLLAITLFATYFGANFLIILIFLDILTNILLYDHGLLDTDPLNCMSYLLCDMNVGITPTTNHQLISKTFMTQHRCFAKCWRFLFVLITRMQFIVVPCMDKSTEHYYLSYYLIRAKCLQSLIILLFITGISFIDYFSTWHFDCLICTDQDDRIALYRLESISFLVFAYFCVLLAYICFSKYNIRFMKSGMILDRTPWILFINFNFFDSIRAFKERNVDSFL